MEFCKAARGIILSNEKPWRFQFDAVFESLSLQDARLTFGDKTWLSVIIDYASNLVESVKVELAKRKLHRKISTEKKNSKSLYAEKLGITEITRDNSGQAVIKRGFQ